MERRRRGRRRRGAPSTSIKPLVSIIGIILAIGLLIVTLTSIQHSIESDDAVISQRTEILFQAWSAAAPTPGWDHSNDHLFSPSEWKLRGIDIAGPRATATAWARSSTQGGRPVEMLWRLEWSRQNDEWIFLAINPAQ